MLVKLNYGDRRRTPKNKYEKREVEICKTAKKGLHKSDFSFW